MMVLTLILVLLLIRTLLIITVVVPLGLIIGINIPATSLAGLKRETNLTNLFPTTYQLIINSASIDLSYI